MFLYLDHPQQKCIKSHNCNQRYICNQRFICHQSYICNQRYICYQGCICNQGYICYICNQRYIEENKPSSIIDLSASFDSFIIRSCAQDQIVLCDDALQGFSCYDMEITNVISKLIYGKQYPAIPLRNVQQYGNKM